MHLLFAKLNVENINFRYHTSEEYRKTGYFLRKEWMWQGRFVTSYHFRNSWGDGKCLIYIYQRGLRKKSVAFKYLTIFAGSIFIRVPQLKFLIKIYFDKN